MRTYLVTFETVITSKIEVDAFSEEGALVKAQARFDALDLNKEDQTTDMADFEDITDYRRCVA